MKNYLNDTTMSHNIVSSFTNGKKFDFAIYGRGYHNAANILAKEFFSHHGYRDYDGYPIVFLYRHALECYLKNIIYWSERLADLKGIPYSSPNKLNDHKLISLYNNAEKVLKVLFPNSDGTLNDFKCIKNVVCDFECIDKYSFSYRYPIDLKGNYSTNEHEVINISSMAGTMDEVLKILEIYSFMLDGLTYQENELMEIMYSLNQVE